MKRIVAFTVGMFIALQPSSLFAGAVCFTDGKGHFYKINRACKASSKKVTAVYGKFHFGPTATCNGSAVSGLHGVCLGDSEQSKIQIHLTSEVLGLASGTATCKLNSWSMSGSTIASLSGTHQVGDVEVAESWVHASCADWPVP